MLAETGAVEQARRAELDALGAKYHQSARREYLRRQPLTARVACTKTSSGTCIRGGQFCPQASYNKAGYDAYGRRYVCKGNRTHPRWTR